MDKKHLEDVATFIRDHRSNESNFESLYQKLEEEAAVANGEAGYQTGLQETKEKLAEEYRKARETGGTAWPEFEKFVSAFEKTVMEALRNSE